MANACSIRVRGVVQGVGFRPFVYRLAHDNTLAGWVLNGDQGVEIHIEGAEQDMEAFVREMRSKQPPASAISEIEVEPAHCEGLNGFTIRESHRVGRPTVHVSPDLPVCEDCLKECFDPSNQRYRYPYINCTNCGPRYSVIFALPYDRVNTTMREWPMDAYCDSEYYNPANRRFHAQPVACPACGPNFALRQDRAFAAYGWNAIRRAAELLCEGSVVAMKGLGGYHLACDARNPAANAALRERKYRKEKPFAVMVKNIEVASQLVLPTLDIEVLLTSQARPIVIAPARLELEGVAPDALVMTSANRSSELARRVDDSIVRADAFGPVILRRSREYAPSAVARLPIKRPVLALGADLKNTITLVVDGQAFVSQHVGDLWHYHIS